MIDSAHAERQVARLARVRDAELTSLTSGAPARALLASIVAEPVPEAVPQPRSGWGGRPVRRLALAACAVSIMTVAVVIGPSLMEDGTGSATSYANSAIEVTREGRFFVARIKDPLADRALYVEAFRAVGKDVTIELVPVSPSLVGRLLEAGGSRGTFGEVSTELVSSGPEWVDCALQPASCTMVIRISADTTSAVHYKLGRAARPGEAYQDPAVDAGGPPAPGKARGGSGN